MANADKIFDKIHNTTGTRALLIIKNRNATENASNSAKYSKLQLINWVSIVIVNLLPSCIVVKWNIFIENNYFLYNK